MIVHRKTNKNIRLAISVFMFCAAAICTLGDVIYVDITSPGANDGSNWYDAYNHLQDALTSASNGDEIHVAQGTYKPDQGANQTPGDHEATFQLKNGVTLEGGYAGLTEQDPSARDIERYETILSGDLNGDDGPNFTNNTENSYHVVTGSDTSSIAMIDGFVISGGNADEGGGGMYNYSGSPTVTGCTFTGNWAEHFGGGMFNYHSNPILTNCTFNGNSTSAWSYSRGGGIFNITSSPILTNCIFSRNSATHLGGAMFNKVNTSNPILINCVFNGNYSDGWGGGICNEDAIPILINCTLNGNYARLYGGAIYNRLSGGSNLVNCILWDNEDHNGTVESSQIEGGNTIINYCCIQGWTGSLGGIGNIGEDPLFVDAYGIDNLPGTDDDNLRLLSGSACIDTGTNSTTFPLPSSDFEGNPRIINDIVDMGAYEGSNQDFQEILLSTKSVIVPEGRTAIFTVALKIDPQGTIDVTVARQLGDQDITVLYPANGILEFTSANYLSPQTVMLLAAEDDDNIAGAAIIFVDAPGVNTTTLEAKEQENETILPIHVDWEAPGDNDGTGWTDAFKDLQEALDIAREMPGLVEIRVAAGTYTPAGPGGNRGATFELVNNTVIYGGYAGYGEQYPNLRDVVVYETILSGDLNRDDGLNFANNSENSYHVVTASGIDSTGILDGFTISGGNSNGSSPHDCGGGMYNNLSNLRVANCTFSFNSAYYHGGGMYNNNSSLTLTNCIFRGNSSAWDGGGMGNREYSSPTMTNCTFNDNEAVGNGGGMINWEWSSPQLINCRFEGNSAVYSPGGGMFNYDGCNPNLINCIFSGNSAINNAGGGLVNTFNSCPVLINCVFSGNSAGTFAGGIWNFHNNSNPTLINCTIINNVSNDSASGISTSNDSICTLINCILWGNANNGITDESAQIDGGTPVVNYSCVQGWTGNLGGSGNIGFDPCFVDVDGTDDIIGTDDDNSRLQVGSPCIDAGDNDADIDSATPGIQRIPSVDLDFNYRRADDSGSLDTGNPGVLGSPVVDMGAYEFSSISMPIRLYVNQHVSGGTNNGSSWENACLEFQDALDIFERSLGIVTEIWVAAGTYKPTVSGGDRSVTFNLKNNLAIYGGFAGGETNIDQRNLEINETILSGDLNGDDVFIPDIAPMNLIFEPTLQENSYNVVTSNFNNSSAVLDGFTITGGHADGDGDLHESQGGGMWNYYSTPTIRNCKFTRNFAAFGGGMENFLSSPTLSNCTFSTNYADGDGGGISIFYGSSPTLTNCIFINNSALGGNAISCDTGSSPTLIGCSFPMGAIDWGERILCYDGAYLTMSDCLFQFTDLHLSPDSTVHFIGSELIDLGSAGSIVVDGRIIIGDQVQVGGGDITVNLDGELIFEGDSILDLGNEWQVSSHGILIARDRAILSNMDLLVTRFNFEDDVIILNSVISAEAGAPYGQFYIEDSVQILLDSITADGDRYLDLDPTEFEVENIQIGTIDINVTEGIGNTQGGLFELRGKPDLISSFACDPNNEFFCQVALGMIPSFDPNNWSINNLELAEGAKLNLTNRFDFQAPYDLGGYEEVLYVKHLILKADSVLNTAFQQIYYETLEIHPTSKVVNIPLLGFSLNNIACDDGNEFLTRVIHNNSYDRIHVERIEDSLPDINGMMQMRNIEVKEPPDTTVVYHARAKGTFAKSSEETILILFEYLFETSEPGTELVIYLTDVPELLAHTDPVRSDHYLEVARLSPPIPGQVGSMDSGSFGTFQKYVDRGNLNFVRGTRIEFELLGPVGTSILINNWDPQVHCSTGICMDITGDKGVDEEDFLTVIGESGEAAGLLPDGTSTSNACLNGPFSDDGVVDLFDIIGWDWSLNSEDRKHLCSVPLTDEMVAADSPSGMLSLSGTMSNLFQNDLFLSDLLILGKRGTSVRSTKLEDCLYSFDTRYLCTDANVPASLRTNIKLVQDPGDELYLINLEEGLVRISDGASVLPPGEITGFTEPRYSESATVHIGIQDHGADVFGRPVVDVAFDPDFATNGYIYAVPVVISSDESDAPAYTAAAKLELLESGDPPYQLIEIYDDIQAADPDDNRNLNGQREIEVGSDGSVYVANAMHNSNKSNLLWRYDASATMADRILLDNEPNFPAPIAMYMSDSTNMLYMASSLLNPTDPNLSVIRGFSTTAALTFTRTITINSMHQITGITEDPETGTLWIVGFSMFDLPDSPNPNDEPFYYPYLAAVPAGINNVDAVPLSGPSNDLALPLSIVWTGELAANCGGANISGDDKVNLQDFAILASQWHSAPGVPSADIASPSDSIVNILDLAVIAEYWLQTGCD